VCKFQQTCAEHDFIEGAAAGCGYIAALRDVPSPAPVKR
jgi:hypothetical protein